MIKILVMIILIVFSPKTETQSNIYDVWNENGLHLIMNDNGTPKNYEDDHIIDYENNRVVNVFIFDR